MELFTIDAEGKRRFLNRRMSFWAISIAIVIVLIIALTTFLNNALIKITYDFGEQAREGEVSLQAQSEGGEPQDIRPLFGEYYVIPRSSEIVTATSENSQTITQIQTEFFSIPEYNLTLEAQKELEKIGSQGGGCNLENSSGVFTHNCGNTTLSRVERPENGPWGVRQLEADGYAYNFARYNDGFLALNYIYDADESEVADEVAYVVPTRDNVSAVSRISLPAGIVGEEGDDLRIFTDSSQTTESFIVANITRANFVLYDTLGDETPTEFSRHTPTNTAYNSTLCNLRAENFICYYGSSSIDHDNLESHREFRQENPRGSIEIHPLASPNDSEVHDSKVEFGIDGIMQDAQGHIYAVAQETLVRLELGNRINSHLVADGVSSIGVGQDFYFIKEEGVFRLDGETNTATLLFRSPHILSSAVSVYGETALLNAFVKTEDNAGIRNIAQMYRITNDILPAEANRIEDMLPFGTAGDAIGEMDYDEARVFIGIIPAYTRDNEARLQLDTAANQAAKERITERLRRDGALESRQPRFYLFGTNIAL